MSLSGSSSSTSGSNPFTPPIMSYGLESGLNTSQIIQAELQSYQQPITQLQNEQSTLSSNIGDYQQINSDMVALKSAADALSTPSGWNARTATVSDPTVATATAASGTPTGSIQFNVLQLAAANSLVSSGTVSSTSQIVTSAPDILLSQGGGQLGLQTLQSGSGLSLGSHTIAVTQASQAAETTGTAALASQSGINITTGSNDTVNVTVDGTAYSLVLAGSPSGGYTGSGLLSALQTAISNAGASGVLQAGYDSSGNLVLSTTSQGSTQSLSVTGGDALGTLGLSTTGTITGTDGVVTVDGTSNTISTVTAGSTVTLNGSGGATIKATLGPAPTDGSSLLAAGSITATDVSTGSGSLSDVVSNINNAATGITASAVQVGTNQYVLQLSSSTTGTAADLSVGTGTFSSSSLGMLKTASVGQNAEVQVGGAGGYTVSSGTNTFTGLLPGLSITVDKTTTSPASVTVSNDASSVASSVQTMVTDANTALSDLQKYAGYNATTKTGGPLMGSATLENLTNQILAIFSSTVGSSNLGSAANAGIKISNGQITFDKNAFEAAFNQNPAQVQSMFTQAGTFTPSSNSYTGQVTLSYASNTTKPGIYAVNISQSATQAVDNGSVLSGGTVGAGETLTVSSGGSPAATVTTTAGESLTSIASALNSAFAANGMGVSAQVLNGDQLSLMTDSYGSAAGFTVSSTNSGAGTLGLSGTFAGTDVAGTINGVAATGNGQFLNAPATDPTLGGLSLQVTATGITSPTALGSFTYTPGVAQALSNLSDAMSNPATGSITQTVQNLQTQSTNLNPQIQMYQNIYNQEQKTLMNQYAVLEATLGSIKNQTSALAAQLAQLP